MKNKTKEFEQLLAKTIDTMKAYGIVAIDMPKLDTVKYTFGLSYLTNKRYSSSFVLSLTPVYNKKDIAAARLEFNLHELTKDQERIILSSKIHLNDTSANKNFIISQLIAAYLNLARERFIRSRYHTC